MKVGDKYIYAKQEVEIVVTPDHSRKVCVRTGEGLLKVVGIDQLKGQPEELFQAYWQGNSHFTIRKYKPDKTLEAQVMIPKAILEDLMALMKRTKSSRNSWLNPKENEFNIKALEEMQDNDLKTYAGDCVKGRI